MAKPKKLKDTFWYTISSSATGYTATKFDINGEPGGQYELTESGNHCTCPAHVAFCRHKEILLIMRDMKRIDTGWSWNKDHDDWREPKKIPDLEM